MPHKILLILYTICPIDDHPFDTLGRPTPFGLSFFFCPVLFSTVDLFYAMFPPSPFFPEDPFTAMNPPIDAHQRSSYPTGFQVLPPRGLSLYITSPFFAELADDYRGSLLPISFSVFRLTLSSLSCFAHKVRRVSPPPPRPLIPLHTPFSPASLPGSSFFFAFSLSFPSSCQPLGQVKFPAFRLPFGLYDPV